MHSKETKEKILNYFKSPSPPTVAEVAKLEGVGKFTIKTWLREEGKNTTSSSNQQTSVVEHGKRIYFSPIIIRSKTSVFSAA